MNNYITIHRDNHSRNFTVLSNQLIRNSSLTYQARFLLIWLLSFNPQEGFKFSIDKISNKTGIPLSRTRSLVQELQDAGYVKLTRIREGNRYGCYIWDIYESPNLAAEVISPEDTPENLPDEQSKVVSVAEFNFNRIWQEYPAHRRGDKKEAFKAFNSIPDANDIIEDILNGLNEMKGKNDWKKEQGKWIPGLHKFIENRIWEQGLSSPTSTQAIYNKYMEVFNHAEI